MGGMVSCWASHSSAAKAMRNSGKKMVKGPIVEPMDRSLTYESTAFLIPNHTPETNSGDAIFNRSKSVKSPRKEQKRLQGLQKSSSTRAQSLTDPVILQNLATRREIDGLETKKVVLVHGGGFGAWCWYKTITLLSDSGFEVTAINLAGSGTHSGDANAIKSLSQYTTPLTSFLQELADSDKVILVGHDFGGICVSYAMEEFPGKIAKSVFLAAAMPNNGQSATSMLSQKEAASDLMEQAQIFLYENGKDENPTAIRLEGSSLKALLFNHSPTKDISLASVSMRPIPFAPLLEKVKLSEGKYGSVRRFYVETSDDYAMPLPLQQSMCASNPPESVFRLKGSDHSPFFSKPHALHRALLEIAAIPPKQSM